nr:MAG TPA: hypothetical protein [Caudoviricetes sp.]
MVPHLGHVKTLLSLSVLTSSGDANSCHIGTFNAFAIFSYEIMFAVPFIWLDNVTLLIPNLSDNSLIVTPFSLSSSFIRFMSSIVIFFTKIQQ